MRIADIILKKRNKGELSGEEIEFFINGYVRDEIPDYQISALLMAIWFNGMNERETTDLTLCMRDSGDQVDLSGIPGIKADKHSTGGVGDTTTLVTAPLVAACGGKVAKMSGRGLGHTGGTLDKLESIPGFSVFQEMDRFIEIVSDIGIAVIGQTANLVPADKKLYSLRDVTGTVDNISLIAGSIMSKKLASGSDVIVLDVKAGNGAFMRNPEEAAELAKIMVKIGNNAGRKTVALVTDMNQPLGNAVGNALEVQEAIEILQGKHLGGDLQTVCFSLASQMLILSGLAGTSGEAEKMLEEALKSGRALEKLEAMVKAQGGNPEVVRDVSILPQAETTEIITAEKAGWVCGIETMEIGYASMLLGAGRTKKTDPIDPAVGVWIHKRKGDRVAKGEALAALYVNKKDNLENVRKKVAGAYSFTEKEPEPVPLIYQVIGS